MIIATPVAAVGLLIAIAPPLPQKRSSPDPAAATLVASSTAVPFRYLAEPEVHALDFDPRLVQLDLFEGWDREQEAYADRSALAFVSGPMYERPTAADGRELTVPLGDLKLGRRVWRGLNRSAARQRAFLGIRHDGRIEFGYGELTPERQDRYDTFIGGLHSLYNDLEPAPDSYRGAYSISMGQQIRYFLPRIRVIYGLRPDGRLEILMSRDGLTLEQTKALARQRGLQAAYLPDHASKSRFIVPGVKGFSSEDANWISGGATSFVHVPYMLRLSQRQEPLRGSLLAALGPRLAAGGCGDPLQCGRSLVGGLLDRTLAGFNRLMEQGVEPMARLIWAPRQQGPGKPDNGRAPFREPVITADPRAVQVRQERDLSARNSEPVRVLGSPEPEAPRLPPAQVVPSRQEEPSQGSAPVEGGSEPGAPAPPAHDRSGPREGGSGPGGAVVSPAPAGSAGGSEPAPPVRAPVAPALAPPPPVSQARSPGAQAPPPVPPPLAPLPPLP